MTNPPTEPAAADQRSVGQLVGDAANQISTLVRDEIRLAIAEMQQKGKRLGLGAGLLGGAGVMALYGAGAVVAGLIMVLALVMPAWLAAFVVGVVILIIAAILALIGKKQAERGIPPTPEHAVASIKQDIAAVKEGAQR
jgi:MFS family permease